MTTLYIIPLYLPPLQREVCFTHFRYLIQHMGISLKAVPISYDPKLCKNKQITDTLHMISIRSIVEISQTVCIALLNQKYPSFTHDDHIYSFRYFINLYSPWFEENENVDLHTVEVGSTPETIDVCTYVLDTCDNHHIFNHHLHRHSIENIDMKLSLYEILEYLVQ